MPQQSVIQSASEKWVENALLSVEIPSTVGKLVTSKNLNIHLMSTGL